jgi:hypothetical protein
VKLEEIGQASLAELVEAKSYVGEALDVATKEEQDAYAALSRAEHKRRALQQELALIGYMIGIRERQAQRQDRMGEP